MFYPKQVRRPKMSAAAKARFEQMLNKRYVVSKLPVTDEMQGDYDRLKELLQVYEMDKRTVHNLIIDILYAGFRYGNGNKNEKNTVKTDG